MILKYDHQSRHRQIQKIGPTTLESGRDKLGFVS